MRRLMGNRILRRAVPALALALGVVLPGWGSTAHADAIVVVPGTAFPGSTTYLAHFGCDSLFHLGPSRPTVEVVLDDGAPLGRRALALQDAAVGGATGPVSRVESVATAAHSFPSRRTSAIVTLASATCSRRVASRSRSLQKHVASAAKRSSPRFTLEPGRSVLA